MDNPLARRAPGTPCALALGTMNFGKRTPADESQRIVRRALERGIRVFDTANAYNGGEAERILGRALGADRGRVVVATKVGFGRIAGKPEGLSREVMIRAIEGSLERLGTDHADLYYLHVPDHATPIAETLEAMHDIVLAGKARAWGVSNYAGWQILQMTSLAGARGLQPPAVSQVLYNALHRQLDVEYFAFARHAGIHTTIFNPLAGGLLSGKHSFEEAPAKGSRFDDNALYQRRYWTRGMFSRVDELRALAEQEGLTLVQLAYAWVASRPDVDSIILGPATVAQLDDAIDAVGRSLSKEAGAAVDELAHQWSGTDTSYVR
jgi:aryl-alcohol dehydrogenase-like predicted oxidoreductase